MFSRILCSPSDDGRFSSDDSFNLCSDDSWIGASIMSDFSGDLGVDEVYIRVKQREEMHLWPLKEDLADWLNTILSKFIHRLDRENYLQVNVMKWAVHTCIISLDSSH